MELRSESKEKIEKEVTMNHLTTKEIFQIVDGTIANGERTKLMVHLEACHRCRQEVQFHRSLGQAAKDAPLAKPLNGFTARIVTRIVPEAKKSLMSKIVDNLGNILAMGLVLSVVWFAVMSAPPSRGPTEPSGISKALAVYVEYYAKARDVASKQFVRVVGEPDKDQTSKSADITTLTLISLLILVAIDRFVVRRVIRIRL
ncbi:MAG: zf-HC2 domain-containing protein [Ignavibacteriales bacterium]|nr:zf-HC2 domain-containing protein [Ignavibacteriales bacterium]